MSEFQLIKPETASKLSTLEQVVDSYKALAEQGQFSKAIATGAAIVHLQSQMDDPAIKAALMPLCGNILGFKADKQYDWPVIRDNIIRARLLGLNICGNEFNIIAGNTYVTSEGTEVLLRNNGVNFTTTEGIPVEGKNGLWEVAVIVEWGGNKKDLKFLIKGAGQYTTVDALQGKARSKAKKWLLRHVVNNSIEFDDDVIETTATHIETKPLFELKENHGTTDKSDFFG